MAGEEVVREDDRTVTVKVDRDLMLAGPGRSEVGDCAGRSVAEEVPVGVAEVAVLGSGDDMVADVEPFTVQRDGRAGECAVGGEEGLGSLVELAADGVGFGHHS